MSTTNLHETQGDFRVRDAFEFFAKYAEREGQRLRDSEQSFDEVLFNEAVELVLNRLKSESGEVR